MRLPTKDERIRGDLGILILVEKDWIMEMLFVDTNAKNVRSVRVSGKNVKITYPNGTVRKCQPSLTTFLNHLINTEDLDEAYVESLHEEALETESTAV